MKSLAFSIEISMVILHREFAGVLRIVQHRGYHQWKALDLLFLSVTFAAPFKVEGAKQSTFDFEIWVQLDTLCMKGLMLRLTAKRPFGCFT